MKRGQEVFLAEVADGEVVVQSARIDSPVKRGARWLDLDRNLGGSPFPRMEDVSASRQEALFRLANQLRSSATHSRVVAADFIAKAERLDALKDKALEMAGPAPKKKGGGR